MEPDEDVLHVGALARLAQALFQEGVLIAVPHVVGVERDELAVAADDGVVGRPRLAIGHRPWAGEDRPVVAAVGRGRVVVPGRP